MDFERRSGPLTCLLALVTGAILAAGVGAWWWGSGRFTSVARALVMSGDAEELESWADRVGHSNLPASINELRKAPRRARGVARALLSAEGPAHRTVGWNLVLTSWKLGDYLRPRTPRDHPVLAEATRERFERDLLQPDPELRRAALRVLGWLLDDADPDWLTWGYGVLAPLAAAPERDTRNIAVPLLTDVAQRMARWQTPAERKEHFAELRLDVRPTLQLDMGAVLEHTLVLSENSMRGVENSGLYVQFLASGTSPNTRRNAGKLVAEGFLAVGLLDRENALRLAQDQDMRERYLLSNMAAFRKVCRDKGWPFLAQRK